MKKLLCGLTALVCVMALPVVASAQVAGSPPSCALKDPKGNCVSGMTDVASMPGTKAEAVTTSDTTDQWSVPAVPRAIYVGVTGDITMIGADAPASSQGVLWKAVPAGTILPFRPRRILASTTSATNLVAIF